MHNPILKTNKTNWRYGRAVYPVIVAAGSLSLKIYIGGERSKKNTKTIWWEDSQKKYLPTINIIPKCRFAKIDSAITICIIVKQWNTCPIEHHIIGLYLWVRIPSMSLEKYPRYLWILILTSFPHLAKHFKLDIPIPSSFSNNWLH